MKRTGCLLLMLALVASGCLSSSSHVAKESRKAAPVQVTVAPPPPPPPESVTPDQVTDANTPDIVQALSREIDYDATIRQPATPPMPMPQPAMTMATTGKR